jgi:hypothetical protein
MNKPKFPYLARATGWGYWPGKTYAEGVEWSKKRKGASKYLPSRTFYEVVGGNTNHILGFYKGQYIIIPGVSKDADSRNFIVNLNSDHKIPKLVRLFYL